MRRKEGLPLPPRPPRKSQASSQRKRLLKMTRKKIDLKAHLPRLNLTS